MLEYLSNLFCSSLPLSFLVPSLPSPSRPLHPPRHIRYLMQRFRSTPDHLKYVIALSRCSLVIC